MMRPMLLLLLACQLIVNVAGAAPLCTDKRGDDEYPMRKSAFDVDPAVKVLDWLESLGKPFDQLVQKAMDRQPADAKEVFASADWSLPDFSISYPNSLRIVRGALLRQAALRAERELMSKVCNSKGAAAARATFDAARKRFCGYLVSARYND